MPAGPPKSTPMGSAAPAALARVVAQAQAAIPSARVARVIPAGTPEAAVLVRMRLPTEIHPIGMSRVYLDAYSGEVLRVMRADRAPAPDQLGQWRYPLHTGRYGGLLSRLALLLVGLTPTVLLVTGVIFWWPRRPWRRRPPHGG